MAVLSIDDLSLEIAYRDFEDGWVYYDIWLRWRGGGARDVAKHQSVSPMHRDCGSPAIHAGKVRSTPIAANFLRMPAT